MKLDRLRKQRKVSKNGGRFYSSVDMATIKLDEAIQNSRIKRGEFECGQSLKIIPCGCGMEGCFILHRDAPPTPHKRYFPKRYGSRHDVRGLREEWRK